MKRLQLLTTPVKVNHAAFDDLYDEISNDWQSRAQKLQIRRWRQLKRQLKSSYK